MLRKNSSTGLRFMKSVFFVVAYDERSDLRDQI